MIEEEEEYTIDEWKETVEEIIEEEKEINPVCFRNCVEECARYMDWYRCIDPCKVECQAEEKDNY